MLELSSSSSCMAMQPKMNYPFKPSSFSASVSVSSSILLKPLKTPLFSFKHLDWVSGLKISPTTTTTRLKLSTSPADPLLYTEVEKEEELSSYKQKLRVVVKPMEKPRVVLKFIWMEKAIGIALNQVIPGHDTIPLTPYYFWPKVDAWEQLKLMLESKPWISQHQMFILLNQATDMIMLWQERGDNSK